MQTLNLKIDDNQCDFGNNYPQSLVINSIEEVRKRVFEAEKRVKSGLYFTEEEYSKLMDKFFKDELGVIR